MGRRLWAGLALALGVLAAVPLPAQAMGCDPSLEQHWEYVAPVSDQPRLLPQVDDLQTYVAGLPGCWGLAVQSLSSGEGLLYQPDRVFVGGSLYKLGVLAEAYRRIERGSLRLESSVAVIDEDVDDQYGGSMYEPGAVLSVSEALSSMVDYSDNGAALALVRALGFNAVNAEFQRLGMERTRLINDSETTPRDLLAFFSDLACGNIVSPRASQAMVELLLHQRVNDRIPAGLPMREAWLVAHKTANVDGMVGDAGIVYAAGVPYVIAILVEGTPDYGSAYAAFRSISGRTYAALVDMSDEPVTDLDVVPSRDWAGCWAGRPGLPTQPSTA